MIANQSSHGCPPPLSEMEKEWRDKFCAAAESFVSKNGLVECLNVPYITDLIGLDGGILSKDLALTYILWVELLRILRKHLSPNEYKYKTLQEFQEAYSGDFDNEKESEKLALWSIANWMNILFRMVNPRKNKGLAMEVVPKFVEGWHVKYVTGSGQTKVTKNRVKVFEFEGNVKPVSRRPSLTKRIIEDRQSTSNGNLNNYSGRPSSSMQHLLAGKRTLIRYEQRQLSEDQGVRSPENELVPTVIPILPHITLDSTHSKSSSSSSTTTTKRPAVAPSPSGESSIQLTKYPDYRPKRVKRQSDSSKESSAVADGRKAQYPDGRLREFSEIALSLHDNIGNPSEQASSLSSHSSNAASAVDNPTTLRGIAAESSFTGSDSSYTDSVRQMLHIYMQQATNFGSERDLLEMLQRVKSSLSRDDRNGRASTRNIDRNDGNHHHHQDAASSGRYYPPRKS